MSMNRSILSLSVLSVLLLFTLVGSAGAALDAGETGLNSEGAGYEINPSSQGLLWISDNGAGKIWSLDPHTDTFTVYHDAGQVSDARQASDGSVWWIDQGDNRLGRLTPATGQATLWAIGDETLTLSGTALDDDGRVWLSQYFDPQVFRFDPATNQLCSFSLDTSGASDYIHAHDGMIWLGDWINDSIHRLDPDSGLLTSWPIPFLSGFSYRPEGLTSDSAGNIWWADIERKRLGRLEHGQNRMTTYALPYGSNPQMLAVSGLRVWYTSYDGANYGTVGRLDPYLAAGTVSTVPPASKTLTPSCQTISTDWSGTLTKTTGSAAWANASYPQAYAANGWLIQSLPVDAFPWGVAASGGKVWVVDNGRQVLARIQDGLSLAACALADGDGDTGTTADQTPLHGWSIQLTADSAPSGPSQITGPSGCVVWSDLESGVSYGVQVSVQSGWSALGPASHSFGQLQPGVAYVHNFTLAESVQVTACAKSDADSDLITADDRTPLQGQTVYLRVDAVRQNPPAQTGVDGCHTWSGLAPGYSYGVEQVLAEGWQSLTPTSHDFGISAPGEAYSYTFVNSQIDERRLFLPLVLR